MSSGARKVVPAKFVSTSTVRLSSVGWPTVSCSKRQMFCGSMTTSISPSMSIIGAFAFSTASAAIRSACPGRSSPRMYS